MKPICKLDYEHHLVFSYLPALSIHPSISIYLYLSLSISIYLNYLNSFKLSQSTPISISLFFLQSGMIRAGLLISAVANELFPLLKPSDQPSQGPWPLLIGFTVGLVFMSLGAERTGEMVALYGYRMNMIYMMIHMILDGNAIPCHFFG